MVFFQGFPNFPPKFVCIIIRFTVFFSISSQLFLGLCFLHLLPDVEQGMQQSFEFSEKFPFAGFTVALGLLIILVIEKLVELCKPTSEKSPTPSEQLPSPSGKC